MTNVAIIGDEKSGCTSLAGVLGKKGTESDIILFNDDRHEEKFVYVDAKAYPKSVKSLMSALNLSDMAILCIPPKGLTAHTGECIVALDLIGIKRGIVVVTMSDTSYAFAIDELKEKIKKITQGTVVQNWDIIAVNTNKSAPVPFEGIENLKSMIAGISSEIQKEQRQKDTLSPRVVIDHFFNVTGIGIVILGKVLQGTIRTHDKIGLYPVNKKIDIRSIQMHDVDVKESHTGHRVGMGLKGLLERELERGFLLSDNETIATDINLECRLTPFLKQGIKKGDTMNMYVGLQSDAIHVLKITVDGCEKDSVRPGEICTVTIKTGKNIAFSSDDTFVLTNLSENQRFVASGRPK